MVNALRGMCVEERMMLQSMEYALEHDIPYLTDYSGTILTGGYDPPRYYGQTSPTNFAPLELDPDFYNIPRPLIPPAPEWIPGQHPDNPQLNAKEVEYAAAMLNVTVPDMEQRIANGDRFVTNSRGERFFGPPFPVAPHEPVEEVPQALPLPVEEVPQALPSPVSEGSEDKAKIPTQFQEGREAVCYVGDRFESADDPFYTNNFAAYHRERELGVSPVKPTYSKVDRVLHCVQDGFVGATAYKFVLRDSTPFVYVHLGLTILIGVAKLGFRAFFRH